jgi:2-amino-4-hydroxy-6-hydroxymethyldihydropteridine diphosphokinase
VSHSAFVGMGSNLGERLTILRAAVRGLRATPGVTGLRVSPLYETDPVGPPQGPYLNAVAALETSLEPDELLRRLQDLERAAGRQRTSERNAPRTLDLDLLLHGELRVALPGLTVPHPRLHERAFVLEPLAALCPERIHPVLGTTIAVLAERARDPAAVRLKCGPEWETGD